MGAVALNAPVPVQPSAHRDLVCRQPRCKVASRQLAKPSTLWCLLLLARKTNVPRDRYPDVDAENKRLAGLVVRFKGQKRA